jgi:hypothetical protein
MVIEAVFALVSVSSTLGVYLANPVAAQTVAREMVTPRAWHRAQVHGFAEALGKRTERFGRLYVDYGVASLTLEWLRASHNWYPGVKPADAIAFHPGTGNLHILEDLVANGLDVCTRAARTRLTVCTREPLPPGTFGDTRVEMLPALFTFSDLTAYGIRVTPSGIALRGESVYANLPALPAGTYELVAHIDAPPSAAERTVGEIAVQVEDRLLPIATTTGHELRLRFTVDGKQAILWRVTPRVSPLTVTSARLERVESP